MFMFVPQTLGRDASLCTQASRLDMQFITTLKCQISSRMQFGHMDERCGGGKDWCLPNQSGMIANNEARLSSPTGDFPSTTLLA